MHRPDGIRVCGGSEAQKGDGLPFPVELRKPGPYESLRKYIGPGNDDYICEKQAALAESLLEGLRQSPSLPLAPDFLAPPRSPSGSRL